MVLNNNLLDSIILHSYNTVPFYRELYDKNNININELKDSVDITKIPVISKNMIQKSPEKFLSMYKNMLDESLIEKRTSGSSGMPLKIFWDNYDYTNSNYMIWLLRKKQFDISPHSKYCTFHSSYYLNGKNFSKDDHILNNGKCLSLSSINLNSHNIEDKIQKIFDFQPRWLLIQPSIAYLLSNYITKQNKKLPKTIKYIEFSGEYLFPEYRKAVVNAFNCETSNMYGSEETNVIAYECKHNNLHCLSGNVIVEIVKYNKNTLDNEEGNVLVTSLTNRTMPFIRYSLGDIASMNHNHKCKCKNPTPIIDVKAGRISDFILINDHKINSYIFPHIVENINNTQENKILQFQIIQESNSKFTVRLVLKNNSKDSKKIIQKQFITFTENNYLKNMRWEFQFEDILVNDSEHGKFKYFINKTLV
ncbi:MAG: hypothetical protein ABF289_19710 [Clostridiales bacterium]